MAERLAENRVQHEVGVVMDTFLDFKFVLGWRMWLELVQRKCTRVGNEQPLPEPTLTIKSWASLLLILIAVWLIVGPMLTAVKEDLTSAGRFREVYAIPRVISNTIAIFVALNPLRLRRYIY